MDTRAALSGENIITLPLVIPAKLQLEAFIKDSFFEEEIKSNFLTALDVKMPITSLHRASTYLYGFYYHQRRHQLFTEQDESDILNLFKQITGNIDLSPVNAPPTTSYVIPPSPSTATPHPSFILSQIESIQFEQQAIEANKTDIVREMENYSNRLNFKAIHLTPECSLFRFWNELKIYYPLLFACANYLFCIPATQNSTERIFSLSGLAVIDRRSSLAPKQVQGVVFNKKNHKIIQRYHGKKISNLLNR